MHEKTKNEKYYILQYAAFPLDSNSKPHLEVIINWRIFDTNLINIL